MQKNIGSGTNISRITNLVEYDGSKGRIVVYGGKNVKRSDKEVIEWNNANAVAKILYSAYQNKGNSKTAASKWGAAVYHAINASKNKIANEVHNNFFTSGNGTAYTAEQKEFAEEKYEEAKESKPVGNSDIKFEDTDPKCTLAKHADGTPYTYIGPLKVKSEGTINEINVNGFKYSTR